MRRSTAIDVLFFGRKRICHNNDETLVANDHISFDDENIDMAHNNP